VFAEEQSITHEIVHAVLDSTATSYFVEEGMAELYSGADVYYRPDPDHDRPADALHMSRSQYRAGRLDYTAAAHFMRFVYAARGEEAMKGLAEMIARGGSRDDIEKEIEELFDDDIEDIETAYFHESQTYYPGFAAKTTEEVTVGELWDGVKVELDCDDDTTRGPLRRDSGGVYHVRWVEVERKGKAEITLDAEIGGWAYVFDPVSDRGSVTNWAMPQPEVDPHAVHLLAGETRTVEMQPGKYLVVFGADDDRTELVLRLRMEQKPGPLGEQG
jgi:hypothetical protein